MRLYIFVMAYITNISVQETQIHKQEVYIFFIVAPCILFQFTKKDQQMHLKSILKTQTKTLKSPYMFRSTTIFREHTWYLADY
jgi:hypothetical protein